MIFPSRLIAKNPSPILSIRASSFACSAASSRVLSSTRFSSDEYASFNRSESFAVSTSKTSNSSPVFMVGLWERCPALMCLRLFCRCRIGCTTSCAKRSAIRVTSRRSMHVAPASIVSRRRTGSQISFSFTTARTLIPIAGRR